MSWFPGKLHRRLAKEVATAGLLAYVIWIFPASPTTNANLYKRDCPNKCWKLAHMPGKLQMQLINLYIIYFSILQQ